MKTHGYSHRTIESHSGVLKHYLSFMRAGEIPAEHVMDPSNISRFLTACPLKKGSQVINGFSRFRNAGHIVKSPQTPGSPVYSLPDIYESYLFHHERTRQTSAKRKKQIRMKLHKFNAWLEEKDIDLKT